MVDAAVRASADTVTVVIPYFGYSRQDRKDQPRVPISSRVMVDILTALGSDRIITLDLHSTQIQGFANIPFDNLYSRSVLYDAIKNVKQNSLSKNKDVIGFVGAPWTLLVYMLNKQSPKKQLNNEILKDKKKVQDLFNLIDIFLKIHIKKQIESGASVIQIFDSWAGLVDHNDIDNYIYEPTIKLVDYVKTLNTPVICFPRNINDYKNYVDIIKPDVINIDYNVDPVKIKNQLDIVVQGGMDPKILLKDKDELKKEVLKFLNLFKDHPYIFNLGHGVLPETNPDSVDYMVKLIRDFK